MVHATAESYATRLEETLPVVRERIARAAAAAGREPRAVRLVAVTKSHPVEAIRAALAAGLEDLGENRVEELEAKVSEIGPDRATWHMIGHIQTRKARRAIVAADIIHSVDSLRLAERIARAAEDEGRRVRVLAQVNTSGEGSKTGFALESAPDEVHEVAELAALDVRGLMTMAPFVDDEAVLTKAFAGLRRLGERLRDAGAPVGPELSMGMTNDLEIAVREGSTMVRIGTALFGERVR
jgi:hypothetical protein